MTATATVYWVSALATSQPVLPAQVPTDAWPGLVGVGVAATFIAIQTFYAGALRVGAAHASLIATAEPIWTIALAAILFQVALTPIQLVGGALILIGVVVAQTGPAAERAAGVDGARRRRVEPAGRAGGSAARGQLRAASSTARAPSLMNAPSEPRPMNRKPSSRWRGSAAAFRSRIPAALPAASAAVVTRSSAAR